MPCSYNFWINLLTTLTFCDVRKLRLKLVRCCSCCFQIYLSNLPWESSISYPTLFHPLLAFASKHCYATKYLILCTAGVRWLFTRSVRDEKDGLQGRTSYKITQVSFKGISQQCYLILEFLQKESLQFFKRHFHHFFPTFFFFFLQFFQVNQASFLTQIQYTNSWYVLVLPLWFLACIDVLLPTFLNTTARQKK